MISEKRLEDIIQNKGTLWCVDKFHNPYKLRVIPITLKKEFIKLWGEENLFATEEEAKEFLKYGNITRTEKLELPMWEEFCSDKRIEFTAQNKYSYICEWVTYSDLGKTIIIYRPLIKGEIFKEPLTRENYDKARDLCIKLFRGEE